MKKRRLMLVFCLASIFLIACGLVACGSADGIELTKDGDGYVVTGYSGSGGVAEIPSEYRGKQVTAIADDAFAGNADLTEVVIPDSVVSIGKSAFANCEKLESITLPFAGSAKDDAEFSHFGYIFGANSYEDNGKSVPASLKKVTLTGGEIKKNAFNGCSSLTDLTISGGAKEIGWSAFFDCVNLTNVTLGDSVKTIGYYAFENCFALEVLHLGGSVSSIGYRAFYNCDNLADVTVSPDNTAFVINDGILYSKNGKTLVQCVSKDIEGEVVVMDGVTLIDTFAFRNCENLNRVIIPSSVMRIEEEAFYGCKSLEGIQIPDGVTSLGKNIFGGCVGMTDVVVGRGVTSLASGLLADCVNLVNLTLPYVGSSKTANTNTHFGYIFGAKDHTANRKAVPSSLRGIDITIATKIDAYAFNECENLLRVRIPDSVSTIGLKAFIYCTNLTEVVLGSGVNAIGDSAFYGCYKLVEVYNRSAISIEKQNSTYGYVGFYAKNIYSPDSGESKLSVDDEGYYIYNDNGNEILVGYWGNETEITLPDVVEVYKYALFSYDSLTSITVPDTVTTIGASAFRECDGLITVSLGNGLTEIKGATFRDCKNLVSLTIGVGVTNIEKSSSYGCVSLKTVYYKGTREQWAKVSISSSDGNVMEDTAYILSAEVIYNS